MGIRAGLLGTSLFAVTACGADGATAPSAAVAPSPTPSPTPTYTRFENLTGDQLFDMICVASPGRITLLDRRRLLQFDSQAREWRAFASEPNDDDSFVFGQDDLVEPRDDEIEAYSVYAGTQVSSESSTELTARFGFVAPVLPSGQTTEYTRMLRYELVDEQGQALDQQACFFGVVTLLEDILPEEGATYGSDLYKVGFGNSVVSEITSAEGFQAVANPSYTLESSEAEISLNAQAGTVDARYTFIGREQSWDAEAGETVPTDVVVDLGSFSTSAPLAEDIQGFGNIPFGDDPQTIRLTGLFFSPQGQEIAFVSGGQISSDSIENGRTILTDTSLGVGMVGTRD